MWRKRNFTSREYIPQRIESRSLKRYCTFIFMVALLLYVLSRSVVSDSMWPRGLQPTRFVCPWGFSRQESWSGLPCPSPGDLPNLGLLRYRQILYWLSHQGSPRILEWVVCPFSRVSSWSRVDWESLASQAAFHQLSYHESLAALLVVVRWWKQNKCPLIDEWINRIRYIHVV